MSAHVLLNLLNDWRKVIKCEAHSEFDKFNFTRARMLDSIKITLKYHFGRIHVIILPLCTQGCYGRHKVS